MNVFTIQAQLPSLNDYVKACRSHWSKGAQFKQDVETLIGWNIKQAKLKGNIKPVNEPCEIYIEWHEKTKRRDVDNIQSAQKFILDAMQKYDVIPNDSRKYIKQIYHKIIDDSKDFVVVELKPIRNQGGETHEQGNT